MTFSVFISLLTTTLNLNLSTISVRLECAAFSFLGIAWVLNFITPSSLPISFASCNSVGIQPKFLSSAQLRGCECEEEEAVRSRRLRGGAGCELEWAVRRSRLQGGEVELAVGRSRRGGREAEQTVRLFFGGGYSSPFPPTRHISDLPPPLALSPPTPFSGPRIFSPVGPIQVLAIPLQSSCCPLHYVKNYFIFFCRHFLIFLRCGSDSWRKSPNVSSKFLPLPHKSGSSHGWCKMNQSMVSPVSTTTPSMLSPSIFEVNKAPI